MIKTWIGLKVSLVYMLIPKSKLEPKYCCRVPTGGGKRLSNGLFVLVFIVSTALQCFLLRENILITTTHNQ